MEDLGAVLGGLGVVLGDLGRSWVVLGRSWTVLGRSWGALGRLGLLLEPFGAVLGGSWSLLGRSKIDQKIDPKLDSKTGRIATEKNGPNTTPVDVSELDQTRRTSDPGSLEIYLNRYRSD